MDREILKYELDYTLEDGSQGFIPIEVEVITHEMRTLMWDIIKEQYAVQELVNCMEQIKQEVNLLMLRPSQIDPAAPDKDDQLKSLAKELDEYTNQIKKITNTLESYNDGKFFRKRFDVIKKILKRNRVTDERLLDFNFWEQNTDEKAVIELLNLFYFKDIKKNSPLNNAASSVMN